MAPTVLLLPPSHVYSQVPLRRADHRACVASERQTESPAEPVVVPCA